MCGVYIYGVYVYMEGKCVVCVCSVYVVYVYCICGVYMCVVCV